MKNMGEKKKKKTPAQSRMRRQEKPSKLIQWPKIWSFRKVMAVPLVIILISDYRISQEKYVPSSGLGFMSPRPMEVPRGNDGGQHQRAKNYRFDGGIQPAWDTAPLVTAWDPLAES